MTSASVKRPFPKKHLIEHNKSVINKKYNTDFAQHCITETHILDIGCVKLLYRSSKGKVVNLLEIIRIKKADKQKRNITIE